MTGFTGRCLCGEIEIKSTSDPTLQANCHCDDCRRAGGSAYGSLAVVTSVVFGAVHGYQGALGVLRTGTMGGVLAWGFISSGSLVPVMIAHTLIDLIAGIALGERLLSPRAVAGVDEGPDLGTSQSRTSI